jgi:hypothetical protein
VIVDAVRRHAAEHVEQQIGIVLDRSDGLLREQLGHQPHHHLAVLEHVGHPGGRAQVILQHVVLALPGTHQVHARDVGVDATWHVDPLHLFAEPCVAGHFFRRDLAGLEDFPVVIHVVQEHVQCTHALTQAGVQLTPLRHRNDVRQDVERDQALGAAVLAVYREGDADAVKQHLCGLPHVLDAFRRRARKPERDGAVMRAHAAVGGVHFVVAGVRKHAGSAGEYRFAARVLHLVCPRLGRCGPSRKTSIPEYFRPARWYASTPSSSSGAPKQNMK